MHDHRGHRVRLIDAGDKSYLTIVGYMKRINQSNDGRDVSGSDAFDGFLSHAVVLDTDGPIIYLGTLSHVDEAGFVLENADVHDTRDGHATKEVYINGVSIHGISPNRRRVLVMPSAVMSISKLDDVVAQ